MRKLGTQCCSLEEAVIIVIVIDFFVWKARSRRHATWSQSQPSVVFFDSSGLVLSQVCKKQMDKITMKLHKYSEFQPKTAFLQETAKVRVQAPMMKIQMILDWKCRRQPAEVAKVC